MGIATIHLQKTRPTGGIISFRPFAVIAFPDHASAVIIIRK
jgi:hypothetical protein